MARSERYETWYRVGEVSSQGDVYWKPGEGYAIERDHKQLVDLKDLSTVEWVTKPGDLDRITEAVGNNEALLEAMGGAMNSRVLKAVQEDAAYAAECEAEKEATLRESSGVF